MYISNRIKAVTLILTIAGTIAFHPGAEANPNCSEMASTFVHDSPFTIGEPDKEAIEAVTHMCLVMPEYKPLLADLIRIDKEITDVLHRVTKEQYGQHVLNHHRYLEKMKRNYKLEMGY